VSEVAVYTFESWDPEQRASVVCERMATADAIRKMKGMADLSSVRLVPLSEIDADGFYANGARAAD
jgi:hypothetical protein